MEGRKWMYRRKEERTKLTKEMAEGKKQAVGGKLQEDMKEERLVGIYRRKNSGGLQKKEK